MLVIIIFIVVGIFLNIAPFLYNYWAERGRIRNYLAQHDCRVLNIKLMGMQSSRRKNSLYQVRYVDFAYNLFQVDCEAASFGYGLNWTNKRFIRRLTDDEIADLRIQAEETIPRRFEGILPTIIGHVDPVRENERSRVSFDSVSDEISIFNQSVPSYSLKEKLIDGLLSHVAARRMNTITYIQTLDAVDEVVVQTLREVALCDPKPWVREHARQVLGELRGEKEKSLKV